jgi:hypothetical protein
MYKVVHDLDMFSYLCEYQHNSLWRYGPSVYSVKFGELVLQLHSSYMKRDTVLLMIYTKMNHLQMHRGLDWSSLMISSKEYPGMKYGVYIIMCVFVTSLWYILLDDI